MTRERHTRREFLGMAGAGVAGVATGASFDSAAVGQSIDASKDPQSADLVVYNASVYTVDDRVPKVQAFAIRNGRFALVGSNENAKRHRSVREGRGPMSYIQRVGVTVFSVVCFELFPEPRALRSCGFAIHTDHRYPDRAQCRLHRKQ